MDDIKIAIIGLGYVGLPLAALFANKYAVIGFDIDVNRVNQLKSGYDSTLEISKEELLIVTRQKPEGGPGLYLTSDAHDISSCDYFIVTVPTPVDTDNIPDLSLLQDATILVGKLIRKGAIVIYESTVFPGVTEEKCVPLLEQWSKLSYNRDFFVGYSPERINPGDKIRTIDKLVKITSGSTPSIALKINALYNSVISAGTYLAPSIKVAEAAKVIENAQRDINIAFMNELSKIFSYMEIDTHQVLEAAGTKWNFLPFKPGLVGGHCIGVDPYYLSHKAKEYGYYPALILSGRRINDSMGKYVAGEVKKCLSRKKIKINGSKILILGITFKENCTDIRNTKVVDLIEELESSGALTAVYDPWADPLLVLNEYGVEINSQLPDTKFDGIVLAVAHSDFLKYSLRDKLTENGIIYDVKGFLKCKVEGRL